MDGVKRCRNSLSVEVVRKTMNGKGHRGFGSGLIVDTGQDDLYVPFLSSHSVIFRAYYLP